MAQVVTFGEIMLRLNPPGFQRFLQADRFEVSYAGAEASVAVSLAKYGVSSAFVTCLPPNEIGQAAVDYLRRFGVDTSQILRKGDRIGVFFVETGANQRPSKVIYDRAHSAVSEVKPGTIPWNDVFSGAKWFHFSGITPAISQSAAEVCLEAAKCARDRGVTVSCDLNFRRKLWPQEKARSVMGELLKNVDVLFTNEEEAETVFGIKARDSNVRGGALSERGYEDVAIQLQQRFGLRAVSISLRESLSATQNNWSGMLYDGKRFYTSRRYHMDFIVDRIGGGDAYSSGIIYGMLTGQDPQESVEFAAAASCLKHTIHGDFNLVTFDEVLALMGGDASGRIQR